MILESVKIKNIRSIKNIEIDFTPSTLLFLGDIGSGKTSVLKAIEFALFGILNAADLNGPSLLRRGENNGSIELTFSIDGKKYTLKRGLRRGKDGSVYQRKETSLIEDNIEITYSPTELRKKILGLLNYSITRYEKAKKIPLFRYTVYTPQEQVKEILQAKSEDRFEILKDIFGIEKYEFALKNIDIIKQLLYKKITEIDTQLSQIGTPEVDIPKKEEEINQQKIKINELKKKIIKKEKIISQENEKLEEIQSRYNEFTFKITEIENKEQNIIDNTKTKQENQKKIEKLNKEILRLNQDKKILPKVKLGTDLTEKQLKKKIRELRNSISKKERKNTLEQDKIKKINDLLTHEICPLCGQKLHDTERFIREKEESNVKLKKIIEDIENLESKIRKFENNLENLNDYKKIGKEKESIERLISEKHKRQNDLNIFIDDMERKIHNNKQDINLILEKYKFKNLTQLTQFKKELRNEFEHQKKILDNYNSHKLEFEKDLSTKEENSKHLKDQLEILKKFFKLKKELKENLEYVRNLREWVSDKFPILLRDIETEILFSSAQHFNEYFKEWFKILVEDENIEVEIRPDDFEPIINVNGYESPFSDLSGGEKSALSLSYRLALNKIINDKYQDIKTKDLLILDEPTDGFSQEQVNRMQEIFLKLNTAQIIIISHERNLESFVTDIYNFSKENHETIVRKKIIKN